MPRPYMSRSAEQLEALFTDAHGDQQRLETLQHELKHRTSRAARALLEKVDAALAGRPASTDDHPTAQGTPSEQAAPTLSNPIAQDRPSQPGTPLAAPPDYELLRASFTEEAEILSRWGMTSAIPDDLMSMVFDGWCARLTDSPDEFGRTAAFARDDRAKLERRRNAGHTEPPHAVRRRR